MKKIDLHIHTIPTFSDAAFSFCLDTFKKYVDEVALDAVAITNHDIFDSVQYDQIKNELSIKVFPGIEVNLENGHILIISDGNDIEDFQNKSNLVSQNINKVGDCITVGQLITIFGNLNDYLVIPHYQKRPSISADTLEKLSDYITSGEVDNQKKFVRQIKDQDKIVPVLFSDMRIKEGLEKFPLRHTYIDCGEISLSGIKACLKDKTKVSLSESDGNSLFQVLENGQKISTGLNVLLGDRSSGKTHTLNLINEGVENPKYIRQFELVQQDAGADEREFKKDVQQKKSYFIEEYLRAMKSVIESIKTIDLDGNERELDSYLESLLKSASEASRRDLFAKAALFDETEFPITQSKTLPDLIASVRQVIENVEFREAIEKHIDLKNLKALICELIETLWQRALEGKKKELVNGLVRGIKSELNIRSSAEKISDVDIYQYSMDKKKVARFNEIVGFLRQPSVIYEEEIQSYKIEAHKDNFKGAQELRNALSGNPPALSGAYDAYENPYIYLMELLELHGLSHADIYKLFVKINYVILNKDGAEASGGERSEFRLLQEINNAQNYDVLLIDEPESSFDNIFLRDSINRLLKKISESMPVVVVTHNNTVGASIGADYLVYAQKYRVENGISYRLYSGHPADKQLVSMDGATIDTHEILMDSLEAGIAEYDKRKKEYEAVKN